ncbi:hypothetical protein [Sphingobacterium lactis]|uniref:Lipocalin-like domain-containing protein n=1 Tax=Sphingobacterium lactis TaxID=797291 RepID=A0A1H5Z5S2_9SPHI|nr:hypothetical protein [Sphingobacterium lactis]SEG31863.1 hypothetical protein SAMN05421877_106272 [Sphingobacterium lactis]
MKNTLKLLSLLFVVMFTVSSCSKDDDPVDNDLFVGTYEGTTSYTGSGSDVDLGDGKVTVVKIGGSNYSFKFDRGIPDLNNVTMTKGDNNTLFFEDGVIGYVRITEGKLTMAYAKDNQTWTADADR